MYALSMLKPVARVVASLIAAGTVLSSGARAVAQPLYPPKIADAAPQGFGDRQNSYAWSMAWWNGKLYVGTGRASGCVQDATLQFYWSWLPGLFYPPTDPDVWCPTDPHDLPLQAEIWRWTPDDPSSSSSPGTWDMVYQSPNDVRIQGTTPQKYTARDIGYRGMLVFTEADGTEALYVAGLSTRGGPGGVGFDGPVPPPRILRSTDGMNFKEVPLDVDADLGGAVVCGFRSLKSFKGKLYVVGSVGQLGQGLLLEVAHPEAQAPDERATVRSIGPLRPDGNPYTLFEIEVFNGFLWAGTGVNPQNDSTPFSLLKTDAKGDPPYAFIPVIVQGGYATTPSAAVISMSVFRTRSDVLANRPGRLYVGSEKEVFRVNPDPDDKDTWDLVVGESRQTPDGRKLEPLSGFTGGWDNFFNIHMWRMGNYPPPPNPLTTQSVPWLYIGTNDLSTQWRNLPFGLGELVKPTMGFDLYATSDGWHYSAVSLDGFGDGFNNGIRTFAPTPYGLFMGTSNHFYGARIYRGANVPNPVPTPQGLEVESSWTTAALTWEGGCPTPLTFHVYRSFGFDQPVEIKAVDGSTAAGCGYLDNTLSPFFAYHYYVVAEDRQGRRSEPSNTVRSPFTGPVPTFKSLQDRLTRWNAPADIAEALAEAKTAVRARNWQMALDKLHEIDLAITPPSQPMPYAYQAEDLGVLLTKFTRRVQLAQVGLLPARKLMR